MYIHRSISCVLFDIMWYLTTWLEQLHVRVPENFEYLHIILYMWYTDRVGNPEGALFCCLPFEYNCTELATWDWAPEWPQNRLLSDFSPLLINFVFCCYFYLFQTLVMRKTLKRSVFELMWSTHNYNCSEAVYEYSQLSHN